MANGLHGAKPYINTSVLNWMENNEVNMLTHFIFYICLVIWRSLMTYLHWVRLVTLLRRFTKRSKSNTDNVYLMSPLSGRWVQMSQWPSARLSQQDDEQSA